jgi:uncharacterized membrane-anchored protein YitT (DUF2179 family)
LKNDLSWFTFKGYKKNPSSIININVTENETNDLQKISEYTDPASFHFAQELLRYV